LASASASATASAPVSCSFAFLSQHTSDSVRKRKS
jgi:hypothetical protein